MDSNIAVSIMAIFSIGFLLVSIGLFAFWVMMLIHAASNPVPNKAIWIIAMVAVGPMVSIVYYLLVKKPINQSFSPSSSAQSSLNPTPPSSFSKQPHGSPPPMDTNNGPKPFI